MADPYERGHMTGVGEVLHRVKATVPRWAFGLVSGIPLLVSVFPASMLGAAGSVLGALGVLGAGALGAVALGALMLVFASVRLVVSEGEISVQLGFAGPRVAIADVASVSRGHSGTNSYGLGVKRDFDGKTTVKMLGDNVSAVHIHKRDGTTLVLVTKENDAVYAALREALARRDARLPRVRVEAPAEGASAESEPEEASRRDRRAASRAD